MAANEHAWNALPVEQIEKDLELSKIASRDGQLDDPVSDSQSFSALENEVKTRVEQHASGEFRRVRGTIRAIEDELNSTRVDLTKRPVKSLTGQISQKFTERVVSIWAQIEAAHKEVIDARRAVRAFKLNNNITREPIVHSHGRQVGSVCLLVALFIVETSANTSLLQGAMYGGLLAAVAIAIAVALINIMGSFLAGKLAVPAVSSVHANARKIGYTALTIYVVLIVYINCVMGVFRAIAERAITQMDVNAVVDAARNSVYPFDDLSMLTIQSVALMIFGFLFAIISLLDGYYFDDPFPEYGKLGKKRDKRIAEFNAAKERRTELSSLELQLRREGQNERDSTAALAFSWGRLIDRIQNLYDDFGPAVQDWINGGDHIVGEYRKINTQFRKSPAPAFFATPIEFDVETDPDKIYASIKTDHYDDETKKNRLDLMTGRISEDFDEFETKLNTVNSEKFAELNAKIDALSDPN